MLWNGKLSFKFRGSSMVSRRLASILATFFFLYICVRHLIPLAYNTFSLILSILSSFFKFAVAIFLSIICCTNWYHHCKMYLYPVASISFRKWNVRDYCESNYIIIAEWLSRYIVHPIASAWLHPIIIWNPPLPLAYSVLPMEILKRLK